MKNDLVTRQIVATATKSHRCGSQTWRRYADGCVDTFFTDDGDHGMSLLSLPLPATDVPADVLLDLDVDEETRRTSAYQKMIAFVEETEKARGRLSDKLRETRSEIRARLAHARGLA